MRTVSVVDCAIRTVEEKGDFTGEDATAEIRGLIIVHDSVSVAFVPQSGYNVPMKRSRDGTFSECNNSVAPMVRDVGST